MAISGKDSPDILHKVADADRKDAELADRERAVKEREIARRERRQDDYDKLDAAPDIGPGEGLDAFTASFDFDAETHRLPSLLERTDGATVVYAGGKLTILHGTPGSGKSWIALIIANEAVLRGGNVLWWDFEDTPTTFKRRSLMVGFDPEVQAESFKYVGPGMADSPLAKFEAREWLASAADPACSLVVIDAAESAGCPSDGARRSAMVQVSR